MAVRLGIDLGTTYSAISWYDPSNGRVENIDLHSSDGDELLRSVVYYEEGGGVVVGDTALRAARQYPERVIIGAKRSMGEDWKTPEIDGEQYTPEQISAEILRTLARDAETSFMGEPIKDVVITIPAHFGDNARDATRRAGEMAGLNVLALLEEPHAAILTFAVDRVDEVADRVLLVYDLGGGTFDVALVQTQLEEVEVDEGTGESTARRTNLKLTTLYCEGQRELGGLDFDRALGEIIGDKVMMETGTDPQDDAADSAVLSDNCERAKRDLSRVNSSVDVVADLKNNTATVTPSEFEERTADLLFQTQAQLESVLDAAEQQHSIPKSEIDVILCGGATRMPMVEQMITSVMGRPPIHHKNPDLLVTTGAAYAAYLYGAEASEGDELVIETTDQAGEHVEVGMSQEAGLVESYAKAVGIEVLRMDGAGNIAKENSVVIPEGASFGEEQTYSKDFETSEADMTEIPVVLYEGADPDPENCQRLASLTITGLPEGRPAGQTVKVTLWYDDDGIIRGEAIDWETQEKVDIVIDRSKVTV